MSSFYGIGNLTATQQQTAAAQALFPAGGKYAVPEPSTLTLGLLALGGLAFASRRKRRNR